MPRKVQLSEEERKKQLGKLDESIAEKAAADKLFNRKYRKSFFYLSNMAVRLAFFGFLAYAAFTYEEVRNSRKEAVIKTFNEVYTIDRTDTTKQRDLNIETDKGNYVALVTWLSVPELKNGDSIVIERNRFRHPVFFYKPGWGIKYELTGSMPRLILTGILCFFTLMAFFLNNGRSVFERWYLLAISIMDIVFVVVFYFLV